MDLSGIVLAVLIVLVGLGIAAGAMILVANGDRDRNGVHARSRWLDDDTLDPAPPPQNAWKPGTWYSEVADGTLFPNQPSPSFRISADSSFQRAIARRVREDQASDEPTRPHVAISSMAGTPLESPSDTAPLPDIADDLEALTQTPTISMRIVPVKDNLPQTLKSRAVRPGHSLNQMPGKESDSQPVLSHSPECDNQAPETERVELGIANNAVDDAGASEDTGDDGDLVDTAHRAEGNIDGS